MNLDFNKGGGLLPVIVQDTTTCKVLMLGYMNQEAYQKTTEEGRVTFYSRTKKRLWTKGETSGSLLIVNSIQEDCDRDTLLIMATPKGPTCHTGSTTCFGDETSKGFIYELEQTICERIDRNETDSYTNQLFQKGINKIAQKVGEEAIELVIEAKDNNEELFINEAADLLFHFLVLLKAKNLSFKQVESCLKNRSR